MTKIIVSSFADSDTDDIITYLASQVGYKCATNYITQFEALYERLSKFPKSGVRRIELGNDARIAIVSPFVVIYDYDTDTDIVSILRFVHGQRKINIKLLSN